MATTSLADFLTEWRLLLTTLEANADFLPHLGVDRGHLADHLAEVEAASVRQRFHKSAAQQATRELDEHKAKGRETATRLRISLRGWFGPSAEKLAEFGLQPRRFVRPLKEDPTEMGRTPSRPEAPETSATTQE